MFIYCLLCPLIHSFIHVTIWAHRILSRSILLGCRGRGYLAMAKKAKTTVAKPKAKKAMIVPPPPTRSPPIPEDLHGVPEPPPAVKTAIAAARAGAVDAAVPAAKDAAASPRAPRYAEDGHSRRPARALPTLAPRASPVDTSNKRVARDGRMYTADAFRAHYGYFQWIFFWQEAEARTAESTWHSRGVSATANIQRQNPDLSSSFPTEL